MVDRTLEPSRFQTMFPGKADPNEFLTPFDPGAAGIGTLWASAVGQKAVREAAKSAADSAMFIHGAVHGQIEPYIFDPEQGMIRNPAWSAGAMETALNVAGPSFTRSALGTRGVADPNTLGIFASTGAKTANKEALKTAEEMAAKGATRDEILDATGWFQGKDGVWRFEIRDSEAKLKGNILASEAKLSDVLDHPELYAAYPEMADIVVKREMMGEVGGYFDPRSKTIGLNRVEVDPKSTLLHEGQHYVQDKEGMVSGSTNAFSSPYRRELADEMFEKRGGDVREGGVLGWFKNLIDPKPTKQELLQTANNKAYRANHGEVESRNVEWRAKHGYDKRPWETIDIPAEKVIVNEDKAYLEKLRERGKEPPKPETWKGDGPDPWQNVGSSSDTVVNDIPTFGYANGGLVTNPLDRYLGALGQIESGNNYTALGPRTESGNQAYGRYQVMDFNIPVWTKEVLGQSMTPQQFLENKQAQDAVARAKFGQYLEQTGNPYDAASMWFSGRPMQRAGQAADVTGTTVPEYVSRFAGALGEPMQQNAEGIASLNAEELALARERMNMDRGPSRRDRQRMMSAIMDYYESTKPQEADFSMLRPMGRRG